MIQVHVGSVLKELLEFGVTEVFSCVCDLKVSCLGLFISEFIADEQRHVKHKAGTGSHDWRLVKVISVPDPITEVGSAARSSR